MVQVFGLRKKTEVGVCVCLCCQPNTQETETGGLGIPNQTGTHLGKNVVRGVFRQA